VPEAARGFQWEPVPRPNGSFTIETNSLESEDGQGNPVVAARHSDSDHPADPHLLAL